jgi:predicted TIM-barrel fold metal-dependent hydrolase
MGEAAFARIFLEAAGLDRVLVDDGWPVEDALSLEQMGAFVPCSRVVRIERVVETLARDSEHAVEERLRASLGKVEAIAFKSIAAYRCGFPALLGRWPGGPINLAPRREAGHIKAERRLTDPGSIAGALAIALEVAAQRGLPIQLHCGFGDDDLTLPDANPASLGELAKRFPSVRFVLLHCWPYAREAGWMASVHANVYADFGLAVPFCSSAGMRTTLREMLHLAPTSRVMWSSDASRIPELFWLGARHGRAVVARVLEEIVKDGDLSPEEAEIAARDMLRNNALRLYRPEARGRQ